MSQPKPLAETISDLTKLWHRSDEADRVVVSDAIEKLKWLASNQHIVKGAITFAKELPAIAQVLRLWPQAIPRITTVTRPRHEGWHDDEAGDA
ncbi:MAG: hypothetical protein ABL901_14475 [Hyphomicrobiaceae bacterium]